MHADIVVIGAGPAGIAAAAVAAELGRNTILVDESPRAGGQIWRHRVRTSLPRGAQRWLARLDASGARAYFGTTVFDVESEPYRIVAEHNGEQLRIHAAHAIIIATGARELFLPFPRWTLPGVIGVGGAQALLKNGLDVAGKRVLVAGSGPLMLPVAAALAHARAQLCAVIEQAPRARVLHFASSLWRSPARIADALRYRAAFARVPYRYGAWVTHALGDTRVEAAVITDGVHAYTIPCDLLCVAYGLVPALELPRLLGCATTSEGVCVDELQRTSVPGAFSAGEGTGVAGADAALTEGEIAARAACGADVPRALHRRRATQQQFAARLAETFALRPELRLTADADTILCRCEDVAYGRIAECTSLRAAKLYTRAGMGSCQGRVCGAAMQQMFGWEADTVRPPLTAAAVQTISNAD